MHSPGHQVRCGRDLEWVLEQNQIIVAETVKNIPETHLSASEGE
jgi:hypothetical protein